MFLFSAFKQAFMNFTRVDNQKLTEWVRLYTKALFNYALSKTSDSALSKDLVQDTFLAAAERFHTFKNQSDPKTWLFGILKNKIADHYRSILRKAHLNAAPLDSVTPFFDKDGRWESSQEPATWPGASPNLHDNPEFNAILQRCLKALPEALNACIRLRFLEEKKGADICRELRISSANYWQMIHRAKLQLRNCLENNWFKRA